MKRLVFLVVVLVAALTAAASAMAASAPKTTGDFGYSFGGVQRHLTFNAIQSTDGHLRNVLERRGRHAVHVPAQWRSTRWTYTHNVALDAERSECQRLGRLPLAAIRRVSLERYGRQRGRQYAGA